MTVGIVTDSAATLPPELASGNEVAIVPMEVTINGRSNGDRRVPLQEVLRHLDDGVRTSSPSPGRFSSAIAAAEDGGGVLVLTVARSMSGTFQVASLAARRAGGPGGPRRPAAPGGPRGRQARVRRGPAGRHPRRPAPPGCRRPPAEGGRLAGRDPRGAAAVRVPRRCHPPAAAGAL